MNTKASSKLDAVLRGLWLAGAALCALPALAAGGGPVAVVSVALKQNPVSLSQAGKTFNATYDVTITNPNNSSVNYKLAANTQVMQLGTVIPTQLSNFVEASRYPSSRNGSCKTLVPTNLTAVDCADIDVSRRASQTISLTFSTPTGGVTPIPDKIRLNWSVTFQNQTPVSGFTDVTLTTVPDSQTTTEFFTTVPTTGGLFFTGFKANGATAPVGGVATGTDLYTTTVQIPEIVNGTTASAVETQGATNPLPSGCQNYYLNCFATTLDIPNLVYPANATTPYMTIILRVDFTQVSAVASRLGIDNIPIYYKHDLKSASRPQQVFFCNGALPTSGVPCIQATKVWGTGLDVSEPYRGDWQWEIRAVDNGRFNT